MILKVSLYNASLLLLQVGLFTSKAMSTNDTDYSCHIKVVEFVEPIICHIDLSGNNNFKKPGICWHDN